MSFWAYDSTGEIVDLTYKQSVDVNAEYRCPSCGRKMYYKSASSNGRPAHFAGNHDDDCDIGYTSFSGKKTDYAFSDNTLPGLLSTILAEGVKKPSTSVMRTSTEHFVKPGHESHEPKPPKEIKTTRQLFNVLASSNPNDILYDDVCVKDVYCGKNTKYLYTKYINGLHLVYAQYSGYNREKRCFYLRYPTCKKCNIIIRVYPENDILFKDIVKLLRNHTRKFVLLFAIIDENHCHISSLAQLVPLRR